MSPDNEEHDWTGVDAPNFMGEGATRETWTGGMMATRPVSTSTAAQLSSERENRLQASLLRLQERFEQVVQERDDWCHLAAAWAALAVAGWGTVIWLVFR